MQGSTYRNVWVNSSDIMYRSGGFNDRDTLCRLMYVALSRASEMAVIMVK